MSTGDKNAAQATGIADYYSQMRIRGAPFTYAQGHSLPSPTSLPPPPETWHFEWSDQYNDYLVYYYDSAGDEDSEIHHSVWKWLVSAMGKVEEDMDLETEGGSSTQPEAVAEDCR